MEIFVKAKPRAKQEKIEKIDETHFEVWVKAPPIQGLANKAIAKSLAEYFCVSPSQVLLLSGFSSREKKFKIE
ncbi:MAG: DUF167 domain-containing protein [Candidatus Staskawiczbacteria bacterium]|jgi:hypothetical protein